VRYELCITATLALLF